MSLEWDPGASERRDSEWLSTRAVDTVDLVGSLIISGAVVLLTADGEKDPPQRLVGICTGPWAAVGYRRLPR